jgi:thiol-disulfide isomerase/thioredoxin
MEAPGYVPFYSRSFASRDGDVGNQRYDIEMTPAASLTGRVEDAEGRPIEGAQLGLKTPTAILRLAGKPEFDNVDGVEFPTTDKSGNFRFWSDPQATQVIAVHEKGFAFRSMGEFATNSVLKLEPWSQIEGSVWKYDTALPKQEVIFSAPRLTETTGIEVFSFRTITDENGRFSFNYVPPGKCSLYRMIPTATGASSGGNEFVEVKPGAKVIVKMGGRGRPVLGRFKIKNPYVEIDWSRASPWLHTASPKRPHDFKTKDEAKIWRAQVQLAFDRSRNYPMFCAKDGSFRIDDVPPGKYSCSVLMYDPRVPDPEGNSKYIIQEEKEFIIPETPDENSKIPFDVGVVEVSLKEQWEAGKMVRPDFEAVGLTGQKLKLSDFRGKYVVIDFWASWCGPCVGELPYLRKVSEKLKTRSDIVMISLSLDKKMDDWRQFLKKSNMPWLQGYLGDWSTTKVPEQYGVQSIPAIFLINPEGRIIAGDLSAETLGAKLDQISFR